MNWDWVEFKRVADRWQRDGRGEGELHCEALFRSVASRAYYSAFNTVVRAAEASTTRSFDWRGGASKHRALIEFLESSPDVTVSVIGVALRGIRKLRNISDYDDTIPMKTVGHGRRKRSVAVELSWEALSKKVLAETERINRLLDSSNL